MQEYGETDPVSCGFRNKCADLLEAESGFWPARMIEEFRVKPERPQINLPAPSVGIPIFNYAPEIYACSFCDKTFRRKGDWKRHEGSLHEPQKQWCCRGSGCNRTFTARNKFRRHHESDHGCEDCKHDVDAEIIPITQTTSVWGCGFCVALLTTWDARANHIGNHFEAGSKRLDWDFSRVIQGLLCQPMIFDAWQSLLFRTHGPLADSWPLFEWSVESSRELLSNLQCGNSTQSATDIAQSAYNLGSPKKYGDELDKFSPPADLYPLPKPEINQEFPVNLLEQGDSMPGPSNALIGGSEGFQLGQPLVLPPVVAVADPEGCDTLSGDGCVVVEGFHNPKEYSTPCAETFEPTAWMLWPYPMPL